MPGHRLAELLLTPVRRLLDPRFHDVSHRIEGSRTQVTDAVGGFERRLDDRLGALERAVEATADAVPQARGASTELAGRVTGVERAVASLHDLVGELTMGEHERAYAEHMRALADAGSLAQLDQPAATLLDYAAGHRGFAAQAGVWVNEPLVLEHSAGAVRLGAVNERIVEVPYAMRALAAIPLGGRVLDFGAAESAVSLSLATLGYRVTALDLGVYPFRHPNLEVVASPLEHWAADDGSFDAALVISAVEHVGLGWYGEPRGRLDDHGAMRRLGELVRPGGTVVLTVPYGAPGVDAVQRRYDRAGLDALVAGFEEVERIVVEQDGELTWRAVDDSAGHAVALVTLRVPDR